MKRTEEIVEKLRNEADIVNQMSYEAIKQGDAKRLAVSNAVLRELLYLITWACDNEEVKQ